MTLTLTAITGTLRVIVGRLEGTHVTWAMAGSLGFFLQGLPVTVNDIDIQTDERGAYEIERLLREFKHTSVRFSVSDRIRSHYGDLLINGVTVEIMGDVEKKLDDQSWEAPPDIEAHKRMVRFHGFSIPVLSLEYECKAYSTLGRTEKARMLEEYLAQHRTQDEDAKKE